MSKPQDDRFRALANDHGAVAATALPNGFLSLVARSDAGELEAAELVSPDGTVLGSDDVVRILGQARRDALAIAERTTADLVAHLALRSDAGETVNLKAIARETGIARQTLYTRLDVKPRAKAS